MSRVFAAQSGNLSLAWSEVLLKLLDRGINKLSPVIVTVSEFDAESLPVEQDAVRQALDAIIRQPCRTVASTIFPNSLWFPDVKDNAEVLYMRYDNVWPRVARHRNNRNGVYFRRLTAFAPSALGAVTPVNQLQHVINTYRNGNHRHSALQACIFDPTRDHTNAPLRGFPCLQQVAFGVDEGRLEVTGFYALQHHISKAYGNYLGLCWLGRFMAKQMGLTLSQVTCVASMLKLGDDFTKARLEPLRDLVTALLEQTTRAA